MVGCSAVSAVEIDLGVVSLVDEPVHDFVLSEGLCALHVFVSVSHWLSCMDYVIGGLDEKQLPI
jgi:hypothetical protein